MKKCVLILARGGSKGIPRKNLMKYKGCPLIEWPIAAALACESIDDEDIYVSTDDPEIREIALGAKAQVIDRPSELAGDLSKDWEGMMHFLGVCEKRYDYVVHLRATFPTIWAAHIDNACAQFEDAYDGYDSLRSVARAKQTPYKMWHIDDEGRLVPVVAGNKAYSSPRQTIPPAYSQNAAIDIVKSWVVVNLRSVTGDRIMPYIMPPDDGVDIDTLADLQELKR